VPTVISPRNTNHPPTAAAAMRASAAASPLKALVIASWRVPRSTMPFPRRTPRRKRWCSTSSIANPFTVRIPTSTSLKREKTRAHHPMSIRSRRACALAARAPISAGSGAAAATMSARRQSMRTMAITESVR
jgi:hypothetical protein